MIAQTIKLSVFAFSFFYALCLNADVLHLNQTGQDELETTAVPKEGIVRRIDMQERIIYWQPYRKGWKWDDDYVEIELSWVSLLRPEIDTLQDVKNHKRLLQEYIQTGNMIPKYEDMWRGPYGMVYGILEALAKYELNHFEEADTGAYQAIKNLLDELITTYAPYAQISGFPSPTTPEARKQLFAQQVYGNIQVGNVISFGRLDEIHFSKRPYNTRNFLVDPRLVTLQCYKYIQRVWKEFKLTNSDIGMQFFHNSFLTSSNANPEAKYIAREDQIMQASPALAIAYFKDHPDDVLNTLKGYVMLDVVKNNIPLFSYDKHVLMRDVYIKVASSQQIDSIVNDIIFWNLEPNIHDGYSPNPFYLEVLKELLARRGDAIASLQKIVQDKYDNIKFSDPTDPGWAEYNFLKSLIVTP